MAKNSMRFDRYLNIQENKKPKKVGIEQKDNWINIGETRKCSFRFDSGIEFNTQFADKVLITATVKIKFDPTINEKMRIVMLSRHGYEIFKILSAVPSIENGRKITRLKVQKWAAL